MRTAAKKKPFHTKTNYRAVKEAGAGRVSGKSILYKISKYEAPSIMVASSASIGSTEKKFLRKRICHGKLVVATFSFLIDIGF